MKNKKTTPLIVLIAVSLTLIIGLKVAGTIIKPNQQEYVDDSYRALYTYSYVTENSN